MPNGPERWLRVVEIYESVIDLEGVEREARLVAACVGDSELRRDVESLIAQDGRQSPLDSPAWIPDNLLVPAPSLEPGASVGPYVVKGVLGAGGMGEVYRAWDRKLGRSVALKILPEAYARDQERRARFQREAQILASLNHPHIGAIHGFEDSGAIHALVLELVEGPTLADRLATGPLPVDEAIAVALQIVDALDAAHEQGVVHRDLKPANIKLRPDGTVKVLDFGLARLAHADAVSGTDAIAPPTITSPAAMTGAGVILGTAAYMSPEQAKGRTADARSDVWAFGCVFYEMLTGKRPFPGEDVAETLAAVLRGEPDLNALPASTPQAVRRLLEHCLRKDRRRRLAAIADVHLELEEAKAPDTLARRDVFRPGWAFAAVAALLVASTAAMLRGWFASTPAADPIRFTIPASDKAMFGGPRGPVRRNRHRHAAFNLAQWTPRGLRRRGRRASSTVAASSRYVFGDCHPRHRWRLVSILVVGQSRDRLLRGRQAQERPALRWISEDPVRRSGGARRNVEPQRHDRVLGLRRRLGAAAGSGGRRRSGARYDKRPGHAPSMAALLA